MDAARGSQPDMDASQRGAPLHFPVASGAAFGTPVSWLGIYLASGGALLLTLETGVTNAAPHATEKCCESPRTELRAPHASLLE